MSDDGGSLPALGADAERRRDAQRRRLAEALRENLQRRKRQSRARLEHDDFSSSGLKSDSGPDSTR